VARCLQLLTVLTGSFGTPGGTAPHAWNKYKPVFWEEPPGQKEWNELLFPKEWPLSHYEMSFLLPHFLKEGRGKLDVYFTRVYNPVWTNPDGMTWMEVLKDEALVGLHSALTPTWNETALFADYVLPMGLGGERHDIQSQETQSGRWVSFRQPVLRAAAADGGELHFTHRPTRARCGKRTILDQRAVASVGGLGPAGSILLWWAEAQVDNYYRWIFENAVPASRRRPGRLALDYAPLQGVHDRGAGQ
jgi:anaerobic selenocysteine-containing dehydrogenase